MTWKATRRKYGLPEMLLSRSSAKIAKTAGFGYGQAVLFLQPNRENCPMAMRAGCSQSCLGFEAGRFAIRGADGNHQRAALARETFRREAPDEFDARLHHEIIGHVDWCKRNNLKPLIRLDGTSDRGFRGIMYCHSEPEFIGYTKRPDLIETQHKIPIRNFHLCYSVTSRTVSNAKHLLYKYPWLRVAAVFAGDPRENNKPTLPKTWQGHRVVDGDRHDAWHILRGGRIIGLRLKGPKPIRQWRAGNTPTIVVE